MPSTHSEKSSPITKPRRFKKMETFNKITIYETKTRLYIVGSNYYENYRILKIDRTTPKELNLSFDNVDYTSKECSDLLLRIHLGNQHIGGLTRVLNCFGLVGFVKFTQGYYICLITKRKAIACIGGSYIYHIEDTTMLDISEPFNKIENKSEEERYINIFSNVDLSKNFYFSYNYNLTQSLQNNINDLINNDFNINTRFVWNHHLLKNGFGKKCLLNSSPWILPLIHGFLDQARISILGRSIYITLIARRSRYFAGARFLKRGSNEEGQVANEVETEQIVNDSTITSLIVDNQLNPNYTSYLQHRGSIPLCWGQDNSNMAPKPSIHILKRDPFATMAAGHFNDLFLRYGNKVIVLNLIKRKEKTPRESKLLKEFNQAIEYLKSCVEEEDKNQLYYVEWDMSRASKSPDEDVIEYLENFAEDALQQTNFFHSGAELYAWSSNKEKEKDNNNQQYKFLLQNGIVRTNCIDCIDRTNAAQFLIGKCALSHQLHALGVIMDTYLPFDCDAVDMLTEMYHDHGDTLALQYGGSNLVNTMATYRNNNRNWSSHSRDIVEAIRRFYTNSFVDADKQDGMNLFLGKFKVDGKKGPKLWELPTDYYLHNPPSMKFKYRNYINWLNSQEIEYKIMLQTTTFFKKDKILTMKMNNYPIYWLEYYKPYQFSSFNKLLCFNLNGTDIIRNSHETNNNNNGSEMRDMFYSPFIVYKNKLNTLENFNNEDSTIDSNNNNNNEQSNKENNIVRFGKWFSLSNSNKTIKDGKGRRSNIILNKEEKILSNQRQELLSLPESEIKTIVENLNNELDDKQLDVYKQYLNIGKMDNSNINNNDISNINNNDISNINNIINDDFEYSYYSNISKNNDNIIISHQDQSLYDSFINFNKEIAFDRNYEAYNNYFKTGKFKSSKWMNVNNNLTPYSTISK